MTGSTAGACAGLSPWDNALLVALDKLGQLDPTPDCERFHWGHALESLVMDRCRALLPGEVASWQMDEAPTLRVHPHFPWMACTVDGLYQTPGGAQGVLEAKITDPRAFHKWDPYPAYHAAQVQWNMDCCELDRAVLCVLVGDWSWHAYTIKADPVAQSTLRAASRVVWDAVQAGDLLGLVDFDHPKTPAALAALYPHGQPLDKSQPLEQLEDPELVAACIEVDRLQKELGALKADKAAAENKLRAALGDLQGAQVGPYRVRWTNTTTRRLDKKALTAAAPELVAQHTTATDSRRLSIRNTAQGE